MQKIYGLRSGSIRATATALIAAASGQQDAALTGASHGATALGLSLVATIQIQYIHTVLVPYGTILV